MGYTEEQLTESRKNHWDGNAIPVDRWGRDHWSTFAYLETRVVDNRGRLYPALGGERGIDPHLRGHDWTGRDHPTRLADGDLWDHDDLDCIVDAIVAGLVDPPPSTDGGFLPVSGDHLIVGILRWAVEEMTAGEYGLDDVEWDELPKLNSFTLTERGKVAAAKLRAHKGSGGSFATFSPSILGWMAAGRTTRVL